MNLMPQLEYSQRDSDRFGLVIYRAYANDIDAHMLMDNILEHNIDTVILRIPAIKLAQVDKLTKASMPFMVADTLVYYVLDVAKQQKRPIKNDLQFVLAGPNDHRQLNHLTKAIFGQYVNHYRNNPFFDNPHVNEGYQDWVRSYAEGEPTRLCWLVKREKDTIGFCTFNLEKENRMEGILYGVLPTERGRGIFRDIMRFAINYAIEKGIPYMQAISQIENISVQRVWTSEGFQIDHTVNTIHINALLSKTVFDPFSVPFRIDRPDVVKVANRLVLEQINEYFDVKQNIVTQNHKFVNIAPLQAGVDYEMRISFPLGSKALIRIMDKQGKTYMLVYVFMKHFVA